MGSTTIGLALLLASLGAPPWSGVYVADAGVNSFQPCGRSEVYWVGGTAPVVMALREYALKHRQRPYQPFYLQLEGELQAAPARGDGAGYAGLLLPRHVMQLSAQLPARCVRLPGD